MQSYTESRFKAQVDNALEKARTILENNRAPQFPADVPHQYVDKYLLAEYLTNTSIASLLNCFEALGLGEKKLQILCKWAKTRSVTIRFKSEERCAYSREETRKVQDPTEHVREYNTVFGKGSVVDKVIRTIVEYFWSYELEYEIFAFQGNNLEEKIVLQNRTANYEVVTTARNPPPHAQTVVRPSADLNITWLLAQLNDSMNCAFSINRNDSKCRTPRRNPDVQAALNFYNSYFDWATKIRVYFTNQIFPIQVNHQYDLAKITDAGVFLPVVPFFEETTEQRLALEDGPGNTSSGGVVAVRATSTPDRPVMLIGDVNRFLSEQKRSLLERFSELAKMFKEVKMLITVAEANLVVASMHGARVCQYYSDGVDYIEDMLFKQLVSAIGKEVSSTDFTTYMRYHNRQLFRKEFEPEMFSYAVRRPDHFPEGTVGIEEQLSDGSIAEPIVTITRSGQATTPMKFSLSSTTTLSFYGTRHVHGWVQHQFAGHQSSQYHLVARARQFSSYIVLLGRILTADLFEPKYAMIVQNKDEWKIPLVMEQIPTPKEFRDAIESLSPEMQRFAKAYRGMQLSSTLFGVLVIQIKPQLEKLLKLPDDSLTKEIRLTQDLMELFIKYQIPSDLLSYAGRADDKATKITTVKSQVKAMQDMITNAKTKQVEQKKQEDQFENPSPELSDEEEIAYDQNILDDMNEMVTSSIKLKAEAPKMSKRMRAKPSSSSKSKSSSIAKVPSPRKAAPARSMAGKAASRPPAPSAPSGQPAAKPQPQSQPQQQQQQQQQQQPQQQPKVEEPDDDDDDDEEVEVEDYTKIPGTLDRKFEELDEDSALRPTIIQIGPTWIRRAQKALLAPPVDQSVLESDQENARNQAFDLLDSLTRNGSLPIYDADFHVVLASTHCFTKNLMYTVIQDNVNPIEKMERSLLIVGTTIQMRTADELVKDEQLERASTYSPKVFEALDAGVEVKAIEAVGSQ